MQKVLAGGDFHLSHCVSNSAQLLHEVQPSGNVDRTAETTAIQLGADDQEMVFGIVWRPSSDSLGFQVKLDDAIYTRGGLLAKVADLFDPLGTAAPLTVKSQD